MGLLNTNRGRNDYAASKGKHLPPEGDSFTVNFLKIAANKEKYLPPEGDTFTVDFLKMKGTTLKGAQVSFPKDSNEIIIDGKPEYFDVFYLEDGGWSTDETFLRIFTTDFAFWLTYPEWKRVCPIIKKRRAALIESMKDKHQELKQLYSAPFDYNPIDESIYKCFITQKSGMVQAAGEWENFNQVEEKLAAICLEKGGQLYENETEAARFAIIVDPMARTASVVQSLRNKGYKVTCIEDVIDYFNLGFNTKPIREYIKKYRKDMIKAIP